MNAKLFNEVSNTKLFEMDHAAFMNHARMFLTHYRELSEDEKHNEPERSFLLTASTGFSEKVYLGRADGIARYEDLDETDYVINVVHVTGPIMRNGGACANGSIDVRNQIMRAADVKQCIGHIIITDTPGGSSYSKFDFKEALDYARSKGQQTIAYVDGMMASAGMALGALCDKIYSHSEHCMLGCMGTYAAFYTQKNGDTNTITQEMFHEIYASTSPEKNGEFRAAAQGDDSKIQADVDKSNEQYLEIIRTGRPNVTDEQLKGGMWEASEVMGTLCDGIRQNLNDVVDEILASHGLKVNREAAAGNNESAQSTSEAISNAAVSSKTGGKVEVESAVESSAKQEDGSEKKADKDEKPADPKKPEDSEKPEKPEEPEKPENPEKPEEPEEPGDPNNPNPSDPDDDDDDKDDDKKKGDDGQKKQSVSKTDNNKKMKQYPKTQSALELEALESDKNNGVYLNEELADKLEAALATSEDTVASLDAKCSEIAQLNETIKANREAAEKAIADKESEMEAAVETARNEEKAAAEEKLTAEANKYAELEAKYAELEKEAAQLKEVVAAKEAEIAELSEVPANAENGGNAPVGDNMKSAEDVVCIADANLTIEEKRAAFKKQMGR